MLGHTFASLRGDRVIALDGNPDAGSLAYRVRRETTNTITGLLAHRNAVNRYADIRAYTSQAPTRLEVVASDDDPRITDALVEQDFHTAVELLETHYNLVCLDTGTGILDSAAKGILNLADQIVVVTAPSLDSARTASSTLDWLDRHGHADLVGDAVAAQRLRGKLLLVSGDMDENVHVAHTLKLADALVRANRDFDLLIVPNAGHYVLYSSGYAQRRIWDYLVRHLAGHEPPAAFDLSVSATDVAALRRFSIEETPCPPPPPPIPSGPSSTT